MQLVVEIDPSYCFVHPEFYEPLAAYQPDPVHFIEPVNRILPSHWHTRREGIWYHCFPDGAKLPMYGWKIHVSATPSDAAPILAITARYLARIETPFKCALDRWLLTLLTTKRWHRGGSGKFITIYPRTTQEFHTILCELEPKLLGYEGPYILSDRRFRQSKTLYYRYGQIQSDQELTVNGTKRNVIRLDTGEVLPDIRGPEFKLPIGVVDPFEVEQPSSIDGDGLTLNNGRYQVEGAIVISNGGGVYIGTDTQSGEKVLIKEARPRTCFTPTGDDAVSLLKKEFRILSLLAPTGIAPRPIDFFSDWEHWFLVEEFIEGVLLRGHMSGVGLALKTRQTRDDVVAFYEQYRRTYLAITNALGLMHEHNVIFTDMSHYNILATSEDGSSIRFIDFEGACEIGVDRPSTMFTPGFATRERQIGAPATMEDDLYGLGSMMFAGLMPINSAVHLDYRILDRILTEWERDLNLDRDVAKLISALINAPGGRRPDVSAVRRVLSTFTYSEEPSPVVVNRDHDLAQYTSEICRFIGGLASPDRRDRLYPADPKVFETNPFGLAWGASGVVLSLWRMTGSVRTEAVEWILAGTPSARTCPPGLYVGLSGIAWTLLETGYHKEAAQLLDEALTHPLVNASPDLFWGLAGVGMTLLRFFGALRDARYLDAALSIGDRLLDAATWDAPEQCYWAQDTEELSCGLAHGASGIALFLLYLYAASGERRFFSCGRAALTGVRRRAYLNRDGGLTWLTHERGTTTHTPYWRWGSSGIGMVFLRYHHVEPDQELADTLDRLIIDADRKYTIFPGRFFGLAGIGEFFLDLAHLRYGGTAERWDDLAWKAFNGMMLFAVRKESGLAFPGETLQRLTCDFGTGSAGIGAFIHRLKTGAPPLLMLDSYFATRAATEPSESTAAQ